MAESTARHRSADQFQSPQDFANDIKDTILQAQSNLHVVYADVAPGWVKFALGQLDSTLETFNVRKNYNSLERVFWIKIMPTEIHDAHQQWYRMSEHRWSNSGLLNSNELVYLHPGVGTTINIFNPPYAGSIKEPDFFVRPDTIRVPSFIIESGWSESATELLNDMNLWLVGGAGTAKIVLLLKWSKVGNTNRVQGVMELYSLDANGIPIRRQREVIFPRPVNGASQQVTFNRQMLFGGSTFPGRNPRDQFSLRLDDLRNIATDSLVLMNMVPMQ